MLDYPAMKDDLLGIAKRIERTARDETARSLKEIQTKLQKETFNLVILGQFKRGKSTLINALLGEAVLPTAIVPLTSVVTILCYGPALRVEVQYLDERRWDISLSDLPAYITERENPQNAKGVKDVTVYYPSNYLRDGVRIIDTPGAGSVYSHNTEVAYGFLPHVDAAIFVVSADPPISKSEHQFLKDMRDHVDKFFFVLNKIDQVNEEDRREALEFTLQILEEDLGKDKVKIHPLAARWALDGKRTHDHDLLKRSLLLDFEKTLQSFFVHEKGRVFLKSVIHSLMRFASDQTISFQIEQEAARLPLEELRIKISRFEEEMATISKDRERNAYLLKGTLGTITSQMDEEITLFKKERLPVLQNALEAEYLRKVQRGGGRLREELEQFVHEEIQKNFDAWRRNLTEKISSLMEEAHREFASRTNQTIERVLALTSDIFELRLNPFASVETLSRKSDFYFLLKDDPVGLELVQLAVTSALPKFIARKMILKNMQTTVAELLDRHCGRVRYDLVNRLNGTVRDFEQNLNEKIELTLAGIRVSLQRAMALRQSSAKDLECSLGELSKRLDSIAAIRDELLACESALQ